MVKLREEIIERTHLANPNLPEERKANQLIRNQNQTLYAMRELFATLDLKVDGLPADEAPIFEFMAAEITHYGPDEYEERDRFMPP